MVCIILTVSFDYIILLLRFVCWRAKGAKADIATHVVRRQGGERGEAGDKSVHTQGGDRACLRRVLREGCLDTCWGRKGGNGASTCIGVNRVCWGSSRGKLRVKL